MLLIAPPSSTAEGKNLKGEETLTKAAGVLHGILSRMDLAPWLQEADCIVVVPDGGRGMMSRRTGHNFSGPWSAPAPYTASGVNVGLQFAGSSTDFVFLMT